jgi:hypothetical protein
MSTERDDAARKHWLALTPDEQKRAICDMAAMGATDYTIAAATQLAVEQVRQVLGDRRDPRNRI